MEPEVVQSTTRRTSEAQTTSDPVVEVAAGTKGEGGGAARPPALGDSSPELADRRPIIPNSAMSGTFFFGCGRGGGTGTTRAPSTQPATCPIRTRALVPPLERHH